MAHEALELHLEGMMEDGDPLPERPRAVAEVMSDPDFADGVPFLVTVDAPSHSVRINVSVEAGLLRRIDEAAERRSMSRSAFLAEGARRLLADA